jgi:hypothetical protein
LFDLASRREIGNSFDSGTPSGADGVFTPDQQVLVMNANGEADRWPASLSAWEDHACAVGRRNFTAPEWAQFVGPAYPHRGPCS